MDEAYLYAKFHPERCSRLAIINMGRKLGERFCSFLGRGAGLPCNTMSLGSRPTLLPSGILIHRAIWPKQIWAANWGELWPFGEGDLGPHLTECGQGRGLPACQVSPGSIRPLATIHQRHRQNRTDRQDRQRDRQRSDSI